MKTIPAKIMYSPREDFLVFAFILLKNFNLSAGLQQGDNVYKGMHRLFLMG